jgi:hypothetical protein
MDVSNNIFKITCGLYYLAFYINRTVDVSYKLTEDLQGFRHLTNLAIDKIIKLTCSMSPLKVNRSI